jgi:hypothetical protein
VPNHGFCYVADCDAYVDEALKSLASLRAQMPNVPVAMVTHRRLFRPDTQVTDWVELRQTRAGPIVKTDARLAPYERVVFLDTDTFVIADLAGVFDLLGRFDFAISPEPNGRPDYGVDAGVPEAFPEPNSGFFAFSNHAKTHDFFDLWLAEYDALQEARGVVNDQPSLRIALWKCAIIRPVTLGNEYNLILHTNCSVSGAVRVLHDRSPDRETLAAEVNRHISPRAVIPGFGPVFGYFSRRGWIKQFLRLAWRFLRVLLRPSLTQQQSYPVVWWRDGID